MEVALLLGSLAQMPPHSGSLPGMPVSLLTPFYHCTWFVPQGHFSAHSAQEWFADCTTCFVPGDSLLAWVTPCLPLWSPRPGPPQGSVRKRKGVFAHPSVLSVPPQDPGLGASLLMWLPRAFRHPPASYRTVGHARRQVLCLPHLRKERTP